MVRAIDANVLQANIGLYIAENAYLDDTPLDILKMFLSWIDEQPTIYSARCGKWIIDDDEYNFAKWDACSICGYGLSNIGAGKCFKYCPNCGSRMDGDGVNG